MVDNTVYPCNRKRKANQRAQLAVSDIQVGEKYLQQCAHAVIRIRAEYLFEQGRFKELIFKDNASTVYRFSAPYTRENSDSYLQRVFGMCGAASLARQTKRIIMHDLSSGDVLIRGGFPGHAVMVMDVAEDKKGELIYLLVQSYMPRSGTNRRRLLLIAGYSYS